jgi:cyanate permease
MGLNLFAPAPMFLLIMEDYNLSRGSVSLLMVTAFLVFTIFLIPGGIISTKLGTRGAILVSGLLMTAGVFAPVTSSLPAILPLRVAFAMGNAILLPATAAVIVQWFKTSERPIMNAVNLAAQGTGVAAAMFLSIPLAEALEWRTVLMVYGVFASLGTVVWLAFGRSVQSDAASENTISLKAIFGVIKERNTLLLSLAFVGPFAMFVSYSSWLPTYYNEEFDMPLQQASAILALLPLMGVVVNVLSGFLLARLGLHRPLLMVPGLLFPIGAFGAFYFNSIPIIIAAILVLGFCFWILLPTALTVAMELPGVTPGKVAMVTAAALTIGNASTVVSPFLVGVVTDMVGSYLPSLSVLAILPITAVIAAVKLPETGHRAKGRLSVR